MEADHERRFSGIENRIQANVLFSKSKGVNMTAVLALILLLPLQVDTFQASDDSTRVRSLLQRVATELQEVSLLSYETHYRNVNPVQADSIFQITGTVWMERDPADSLFGARFHVRGQRHDNQKGFDYFYDGQYGYELWQDADTLIVFFAHEFENSNQNPAKARVALSPFIELFTRTDLVESLFKHDPKVSLAENALLGQWIVELRYPENELGMVTTRTLHIDPRSSAITRDEQYTRWRGLTFRMTKEIENYHANRQSDSDSVYVGDILNRYATRTVRAEDKPEPAQRSSLVGTKAPYFSYPTYEGKKLSLSDLKEKVVLLDFWESWCGWCFAAFPKLNELQQRYRDRGVVVVGVTTENREQIEKLIQANELNYLSIFGDEHILKDYEVSGRPTYVLVDREGLIAEVSYGDLEAIETALRDILNRLESG